VFRERPGRVAARVLEDFRHAPCAVADMGPAGVGSPRISGCHVSPENHVGLPGARVPVTWPVASSECLLMSLIHSENGAVRPLRLWCWASAASRRAGWGGNPCGTALRAARSYGLRCGSARQIAVCSGDAPLVGIHSDRRIWSPRSTGFEALVHSVLGVLYAAVVRRTSCTFTPSGPRSSLPSPASWDYAWL